MIFDYINKFREKYNQQRGQRYLSRGIRDKAYKCFEKALLLNNDYVNQFNMALVLISMNKHNEAISLLEKVLEKYPDNELVLTTLAESYMILRNWDQAIERYMQLNDEHPKHSLYIRNLNRAKDVVGREKYVRSRELFFKGMELLDEQKYDESLAMLNEALELDPDNAIINNTIGHIMLMAQKKNEEIIPYFEKAVLLSPQNENYKRNLAQIKSKKIK